MKINTLLGPRAHGSKDRGAAAVEFAILIGLLVLITGGIIEFGRVFWYYDSLTKATRDGARMMSNAPKIEVGDYVATAKGVMQNEVAAAGLSPALTSGNINIQCDYGAGWTNCMNAADETVPGPNEVNVAITGYSVTFGSWFAIPLPVGDWLLRPHTTMRYMH